MLHRRWRQCIVTHLAVLASTVVLVGVAHTSTEVVTAARPSQVIFITGVKDNAGQWMPLPGDSVLYLPDRSFYGWMAEMPSDAPVIVKEVLALPAPAKTWPAFATVSADGRTGTVVRTLSPESGRLISAWTVAEGDPFGDYTLAVSIAAKTYTFRFRVVPFNASGASSLAQTSRTIFSVGAISRPTGGEGE